MLVDIDNHDFTIIWDGVYYFALSDYPNVSPWEKYKLRAFCEYERAHGRETAFKNPPDFDFMSAPAALPPGKITECTACRQGGCLTDYLCHTAPIENAVSILKCGGILSAVRAFGVPAEKMAKDPRNAAGDPPDYFEYAMLSWGNCQAGDRLVMERKLGRDPTAGELETSFTPGVRFYFKYSDIIRHPAFTFDGYHPAKVKDEIRLEGWVYAIVAPEEYRYEIEPLVPENIRDRVQYIDRRGMGIWDWSSAVYTSVAGDNGI